METLQIIAVSGRKEGRERGVLQLPRPCRACRAAPLPVPSNAGLPNAATEQMQRGEQLGLLDWQVFLAIDSNTVCSRKIVTRGPV